MFGVYSFFANSDVQTTFNLSCTRNGGPPPASFDIAISGSTAGRTMARSGGGTGLTYNLYRDAARTMVWGSTTGVNTFTQTAPTVPNNTTTPFSFTIYGRIASGQDVTPGSFDDTLTITVTY